jgi:hypothetical protein
MKKNGILDEEDAENVDLENYTMNGRLFQFDSNSRTHFADDVQKTAKDMGYDVVKMIDDLGSEEENVAWVVVDPSVLSHEGEEVNYD